MKLDAIDKNAEIFEPSAIEERTKELRAQLQRLIKEEKMASEI